MDFRISNRNGNSWVRNANQANFGINNDFDFPEWEYSSFWSLLVVWTYSPILEKRLRLPVYIWIINLVNLGHQPRLTRLSGESRGRDRATTSSRPFFGGLKIEKRDSTSCLNNIFCIFHEKGFSTITLEETFCYVVMSSERRKRERVEAIFWRIEKKDFMRWLMSYLKRTFSTYTL